MACYSDILHDYENILLGNKQCPSDCFFTTFDEVQREKNALKVFRAAFEYYMNWSPEKVKDKVNKKVLEDMKLMPYLKFIIFPAELIALDDLWYLAVKLYPQKFVYNQRENINKMFQKVINGEMKKLPKDYLSDSEGELRACICLQYLISNYKQFSSFAEMYDFFSSLEGKNFLKKYRLLTPCSELFDSPIDFLHASLPTKYKQKMWKDFYKLNDRFKTIKTTYKGVDNNDKE